jgi:hypothetical protein|tara:strand:- start:574 stop:873 length:300 start_codon:yes stop_codon:yes gene_type:complete
MSKSKKQTKQEQASMQSDAVELDSWIPSSDGVQMTGSFGHGTIDSLDPDVDISYSFDGQLDLFSEEDLREKYPALKDAWQHYQAIKKMCETREKEENEN